MGFFVDFGKHQRQNLQRTEPSLFSSLGILIISILYFLTTISEINLGVISFFIFLFQAQAAEVQEGSVYPCAFL